MNSRYYILWLYGSLITTIHLFGQGTQTTYSNPTNIDYGYVPIPGAAAWGRHRATADLVMIGYKADYYLFSTNQCGYWHILI